MQRDVFFITLPGALALDLTGPAETLRLSGHFQLHYISPLNEVELTTGLVVSRLLPLPSELPDGSIIMVPGVSDSATQFDTHPARLCRDWLAAQKPAIEQGRLQLVCICSGSLLAGMAGLLDGYQCTSHHDVISRLRERVPAALVKDNRIFVEDRSVLTSAGITAGIDLALYLVAQYLGPQAALDVAREMVVYFRRAGEDPQLSPWLQHRNHLHPAVHRAQNIISSDPESDWQVEDVAAKAHISSRHLTRLFRQYLGISVRDYHEQLRIAVARQRIQQGLGQEKAALAAGFSSGRQLRRALLRWQPE
ncbi:GlxA family transcriptional regulator [Serratia sp. M24T3]|uniref:GlxA family transcriptional regulator n=1 Tax=Serratia sp. M24T3 TaxID=932213 RepID=UPI00025BA663|nr:helix-turn-helix domain-containing protein [Serratia sp. M24T3]EIC85618.1 AraC family transcriptional regulator [Serratia sp. M24T3]